MRWTRSPEGEWSKGPWTVNREWRRLGGTQWILRGTPGQLGPLGKRCETLKEAKAVAEKLEKLG